MNQPHHAAMFSEGVQHVEAGMVFHEVIILSFFGQRIVPGTNRFPGFRNLARLGEDCIPWKLERSRKFFANPKFREKFADCIIGFEGFPDIFSSIYWPKDGLQVKLTV